MQDGAAWSVVQRLLAAAWGRVRVDIVGEKLPTGLRVLLAEDEPLIAMHGDASLRSLGVDQVMVVRTVSEGLKAVNGGGGGFHAAFLDLRLGADTSLALAQRLLEAGVPFAFLTGYQGDAIPAEFKDRPIVAKPFTTDQLSRALRTLVR